MYYIDDMAELTEKDRKLLSLLKTDARTPLSELARKMKLARSTVQARIERLEDMGVIDGYSVRMGPGYLNNLVRATVLAEIQSGVFPDVMAKIQKIPEVQRVSSTAGRYDLILEIEVDDLARLDEIIDNLEEIDGFDRSESLVHLSTRLDRRI